MILQRIASKGWHALRACLVAVTVFQFSLGPLASPVQAQPNGPTRTPIKHVIVLIGENRTFDHVFATYVPKSQDTVRNLLSEGIVTADGAPGPNFGRAAQYQATPPFQTSYFTSLNA